jgi:predicted metalloprotease
MRWMEGRRSENVEDRRGMPGGGVIVGGGLGTLVLALIIMFLGGDPIAFLNQVQRNAPPPAAPGAPGAGGKVQSSPEEDRLVDFVKVVLGYTEDVWSDLLPKETGKTYEAPRLELFRQSTRSGCGFASAAVGPFYCPVDRKVYLDLGFFEQLRDQFHAPGEFAQAYVIAHEVGHHVQNLLGISDRVRAEQQRADKVGANRLSVRLELQADFLAGVWANHAQKSYNILERGDVETALRAATAIGDDKLQQQSQGYVVPDAFTHGTARQRVKWFSLGLKTGDLNQGNTFDLDDDEL